MKCYNLVFYKKILKNNIGFYCMNAMLILELIFLSIFFIKKLEPLKHFMLLFYYSNNKNIIVPFPQSNDNRHKSYKKKKKKKKITTKKIKINENNNIENTHFFFVHLFLIYIIQLI